MSIEREAAISVINGKSSLTMTRSSLIDSISDLPAADVAPVVHGEWEIVVGSNGKEYMVCTRCRVSQDLTGVFTYCPNCGTKMDGGNSLWLKCCVICAGARSTTRLTA